MMDHRVSAAAVCGSYARGTPGPESDLDICLFCLSAQELLADTDWVYRFGAGRIGPQENFGLIRSIRIHYDYGLEVEFGVAEHRWLELPLDAGSIRVINDGFRILYDPEKRLKRAVAAAEMSR